MANFSITTTTKKSPEEVCAYLADMTNAASWDPGVVAARRLDEGELKVGSQFEVGLKAAGQSFTLTYTLVEYEPPNHLVLSSENAFIISRDTVTIALDDEGATSVTYSAELNGKGVASVLEPLWKYAITTLGNHAASGFLEQFGA